MEKIRELNWFQRIVLLLLAVMLAVFFVVYCVVTSREGFAYHDEIFVPAHADGNTVYSGKIDGIVCAFTVTKDKTIFFVYGETRYGPYTVQEDPTAVPEDKTYMTGVNILVGGNQLFRGGFLRTGQNSNDFMLFRQDGKLSATVYSSGTVLDSDGTPVDPLAPTTKTILSLFYGPELTHKGQWGLWFLGLLFSVIVAVHILFADELFYWKLSHSVQNPELAEPSELEIFSRYLYWSVMPIIILIGYFMGLR